MSVECKAALRTSFVPLLLLFAGGMLVSSLLSGYIVAKVSTGRCDFIELVAAALALIRLLANLHIWEVAQFDGVR